MAELRLNLTVSLDGYVAGPDQSVEQPLGAGGEALHEWALATRRWRDQHGRDGGEVGVDDEAAARMVDGIGAVIMGRKMFGGGPGAWSADPPWTGWWGDEPPFHAPVFVLTHHAREPVPMRGGTTFHFVTGGPEEALRRAGEAAGEGDVSLAGGAATARQYLAAGLVDRIDLHVAPVLLGGGERLFDLPHGWQRAMELEAVAAGAGAVHYRYRRAG